MNRDFSLLGTVAGRTRAPLTPSPGGEGWGEGAVSRRKIVPAEPNLARMRDLFACFLVLVLAPAFASAETTMAFDLKASRAPDEPKLEVTHDCRAAASVVRDEDVTIDGDLSDWPANATPLRARGEAQPDDLSAVAFVAVSPTSFYFACEVTDDQHYQRAYGDEMWQFDSVQFAIDPLFERTVGRYSVHTHEIGICFVNGGPLVWRWHRPLGLKGEEVPGADLAVAFSEGKTTYELRIPLHELWPLRPALAHPVGFTYVVNDTDGSDSRDFIAWASGIGSGKDSSSFGILTFPEDRQDVQVAARFLAPTDPTPADHPQEWTMHVYAKQAGKLTVECDGKIEHGPYKGSRAFARTRFEVPAGVSNWRLSADLARLAPARIKLRPSVALENAADAVESRPLTVYVYRPSR